MKRIYPAKVKNGRLIINDLEAFRAHYKSMEGQEVDLTIGKHRNRPSNKQYGYYFGCLLELYWCPSTGYTPYQMDHVLKTEYAKFKGLIDDRGWVIVPSKSNDFDTLKEEEYHQFCRDFYEQMFGVEVPLPDRFYKNYKQ